MLQSVRSIRRKIRRYFTPESAVLLCEKCRAFLQMLPGQFWQMVYAPFYPSVCSESISSSQIFLEMHMGKNDFLMMLFQLYPFHRSLSLLYKKKSCLHSCVSNRLIGSSCRLHCSGGSTYNKTWVIVVLTFLSSSHHDHLLLLLADL